MDTFVVAVLSFLSGLVIGIIASLQYIYSYMIKKHIARRKRMREKYNQGMEQCCKERKDKT